MSRPDLAALRERVAFAVGAVLAVPPDQAASAGSLFDLPGFDSLAVVAVLDRLESGLGVEVPPELIVPEAFESVDALTSLLGRAIDAAAAVMPSAGGHP